MDACGSDKGLSSWDIIFGEMMEEIIEDYLNNKLTLEECLMGRGPFILLDGFKFRQSHQYRGSWIPETVDQWLTRNRVTIEPKIRVLLEHVYLMMYVYAILPELNPCL